MSRNGSSYTCLTGLAEVTPRGSAVHDSGGRAEDGDSQSCAGRAAQDGGTGRLLRHDRR